MTASEVVNLSGGSIVRTIDNVRIWAKLKHKKARYGAIELIEAELMKPAEQQDFRRVIKEVQNLPF